MIEKKPLYKYMPAGGLSEEADRARLEGKTIKNYFEDRYGKDCSAECIRNASNLDFMLYKINFILGEQKLFFGDIDDQNDLFENQAIIEESLLKRSIFEHIVSIRNFEFKGKNSKKEKGKLKRGIHEYLQPLDTKNHDGKSFYIYKVGSCFRDATYKKPGVCCFTEDHLNPYMWTHYANSNQGLAIEFSAFDIDGDISHTNLGEQKSDNECSLQGPWKISNDSRALFFAKCVYNEMRLYIDSNSLDNSKISKNGELTFSDFHFLGLCACTNKATEYKREKEWRLILADDNNTSISISNLDHPSNPLKIKKIIVGNKMNNDLLDWIKKSYGHIQIHKVAIDNDSLKFNLKAEPLIDCANNK